MHHIRQESGTIGLQIQQHSRIKCACLSSSSELLGTLYQEHLNQRHSLHFHRYPSTAQHTSTTVRMRACVRTPADRDICTTAAQQQRTVRAQLTAVLWSTVRYSSVCINSVFSVFYTVLSTQLQHNQVRSYSYDTYLTMTQFPLTPCSRANAKPKYGRKEEGAKETDKSICLLGRTVSSVSGQHTDSFLPPSPPH